MKNYKLSVVYSQVGRSSDINLAKKPFTSDKMIKNLFCLSASDQESPWWEGVMKKLHTLLPSAPVGSRCSASHTNHCDQRKNLWYPLDMRQGGLRL
jgi:hypothetical protein